MRLTTLAAGAAAPGACIVTPRHHLSDFRLDGLEHVVVGARKRASDDVEGYRQGRERENESPVQFFPHKSTLGSTRVLRA
jgi:hypothetical protein